MRRELIRRVAFFIKLGLLVFCAIVTALVLRKYDATRSKAIEVRSLLESASGEAQALIKSQGVVERVRFDWQQIRNQPPVFDLRDPGVPVVRTPPPIPPGVPLSLIGTFTGGGAEPYAIIEDGRKRTQDVFIIGDSIFGEAVLKVVYADKVEIDRAGNREILALDDAKKGGGAPTDSSAGGSTVAVNQGELQEALSNLPLLLTQARAVPYFQDGKSVGLRLFAIKTGSLFEKIGLQNGDILKSINGSSLGDMTQAIGLFEQLRSQKNLTVVLERRRQEQTINYTIN